MKRFFILPIVLSAMLAADGQALDLQSRAALRRHKMEQSGMVRQKYRLAVKESAGTSSSDGVNAFVTLADGATTADLREAGVEIVLDSKGIIIINLPYDRVEEVSSLPCVKSLSLQKSLSSNIDLGRQATGVSQIHAGAEPLDRAYTGKGVVTAIVDQGVDPNHISFKNSDGSSSIGYLSHVSAGSSSVPVISWYGDDVQNAQPISQFSTDTKSTYHGTHTLGILAGRYKGDVELASLGSDSKVSITNTSNPFYGVATESDIAVSCGDLQDVLIAYGIDYLYGYGIEYRKEPMVLSLSLGSNTGPHDTSSSLVKMLDMVGKEMIVCIAAGNEGDLKIALPKNLTASDNKVKSLVYPYAYRYDPESPVTDDEFDLNNYIRYGSIAVYSNDSTPFTLKAFIYNRKRKRVAMQMPVKGDGVGTYYCSSTDWQMEDTDVVGDANFKKAFNGYVGVGSMIHTESNRYYGMVDYYIFNNRETNADDNYCLGFEVTGVDGQRIECYCDGVTTWIDSEGLEGFDDGSCNGSISDMAVGNNVIVVGSYNTRSEWGTLAGEKMWYEGAGFNTGHISGFSSFGTLADGRNLPTVCAPGSAIISAMSNPYLDYATQSYTEDVALAYKNGYCSARATDNNGRTYYWKQEVGTSMSTPLVAGAIALWLEADPTLTIDDVKDIIAATSTRDEIVNSEDSVRWGAGKFNALEGLKEVIRRAGAGVEDVIVDGHNSRLMVNPTSARCYNLFLGNATSLQINVYDLSGNSVYNLAVDGNEADIDLSSLGTGVYILNVNGVESRKLLVK